MPEITESTRRIFTDFTASPCFMAETRIREMAVKARAVLTGAAGVSATKTTAVLADGAVEVVAEYNSDLMQGRKPYQVEEGVATLPIVGVLSKYPSPWDDWCGLVPTTSIEEKLGMAVDDPAVDQIVLVIDCPGGAVNGTVELAYAVAAANKIKPVIAFISGLCASGGYYVASQCRQIIAAPGSEIGCIGVYCVLIDWSKVYADFGVALTLVSSGGVKGLGADGKVTQELIDDQQRVINALKMQFVSDIAVGRKMDLASVDALADGRCWLPPQARQFGLIDGVASLDAAKASLTAPATAQENSPMATATTPAAGKPKAADGEPEKIGNQQVRDAMQACIKAATNWKDTSRQCMDACSANTEDPDQETKDVAKQCNASCEAAADEAERCADVTGKIAGVADDDGDGDETDDTGEDGEDAKDAKKNGKQGKPATVAQLRAAFPDNANFVIDQIGLNASLLQAKAAYADVLATELKAEKAKNAKLTAEIRGLTGGTDPVQFAQTDEAEGPSTSATTQESDPDKAKAIAKREWVQNKDNCKSRFASEDIYVNVRKRELAGT